jgi:hypothetical protein
MAKAGVENRDFSNHLKKESRLCNACDLSQPLWQSPQLMPFSADPTLTVEIVTMQQFGTIVGVKYPCFCLLCKLVNVH